MRREPMAMPIGVDIDVLATRVRYVGSVEHKRYPSFAGQPRPRADATLCDPSFTDPAMLTDWLAEGIRSGHVGAPLEGEFPRYIWVHRDDIWYEARLTNAELGEYKGYGLDPSEIDAAMFHGG